MITEKKALPRLLQVTQWDKETPVPRAFFGEALPEVASVLYERLANVRLALIGFWATYDHTQLDSNTVKDMGQDKQNLDIDMFVPMILTDKEYWESVVESGRDVTPVGRNENIVICNGYIFISPGLSQKESDELRDTVHTSLVAHLDPQNTYEKVGRTGQPLIVIGKDASMWGVNRRDQSEDNPHIYIEAMPLFVTTSDHAELESQLESIGISRDLSPVYCMARKSDDEQPDLKLIDSGCKHYQFAGLPALNMEYISSSPTNALNFIRREVKAIALYAQFGNDHPDHISFTESQINLLREHIQVIESLVPSVRDYPELVDKINGSFSRVAKILNSRFGIGTPETILSSALPIQLDQSQLGRSIQVPTTV